MRYDNDPHNPYREGQQQNFYRSARPATRPSALAILSVLSGLLSFPMMCLLVLSLPFSVFAIVAGHMARGVIRSQPDRYAGTEMATIGLLSGYTTLILMGGGLMIFTLAATTSKVITVNTSTSASSGQTLLDDARAQLMNGSGTASFGVSTADHDANSLARHYIESLHVRDELEFSRTGESEDIAPREYRVYVRLNADSVAYLVRVPEFERFTDDARQTLFETCWTIAQRSVDHILPAGSEVGVGIYSDAGVERVLTGKTVPEQSAESGLKKQHRKEKALAAFFKVPDRQTDPASSPPADDAQQIDIRRDSLPELPAELGASMPPARAPSFHLAACC